MNIGWKLKQTYVKWRHLGFDRHFTVRPVLVIYGFAWTVGAFIIITRHLGMKGPGVMLAMSTIIDITIMTGLGLIVLYGPKILVRGVKNLRFLAQVKKSRRQEKRLETVVITDKPR